MHETAILLHTSNRGKKGTREGKKGAREGKKGAREGKKGAREGKKGAREGKKGTREGKKGTREGKKGAAPFYFGLAETLYHSSSLRQCPEINVGVIVTCLFRSFDFGSFEQSTSVIYLQYEMVMHSCMVT